MRRLNKQVKPENSSMLGPVQGRWLLVVSAVIGLSAGIFAGPTPAQSADETTQPATTTEAEQGNPPAGETGSTGEEVQPRAVLPTDPARQSLRKLMPRDMRAKQELATYYFLDAIAQGPTAVLLTWTNVTGAAHYDLYRNGAKINTLSPEYISFRDTGVVPGVTYRYQVHAHRLAAETSPPQATQKQAIGILEGPGTTKLAMAETTILRSSRVMEVVTPPVPTPRNVRAQVNGAQVQLSWDRTFGASAYVITRDQQVIGRVSPNPTGFVPTAYTDSLPASAGGRHSYAILTGIKGDSQAEFLSSPSSEVNVKVGPFNVLAVGDSVMWGQGLMDPNKFTTKVKTFLQAQLGRPVNLVHLAHSGGVFSSDPPAPNEPNAVHGEVPTDFPTLGRQVFTLAPRVLPRKEDVDLILLDGCANDVGLTTIMNPNTSEQALLALTNAKCHDKMKSVLSRLVSGPDSYPNANIVVTGYYPAVSQESNVEDIERLVVGVGAATPVALGLFLGIPPEPITAAIVTGIIANELRNKLEALKQKLIVNTTAFSNQSNSFLAQAIAESDPSRNRIKFASPAFTPMNAFRAPQSFLWPIPHPNTAPGTNPENPAHWVNKDEVFDARWATCDGIQDPTLDDVKCRVASSAHPNVLGAQAYTNAIIGQIAGFLPAWRQILASVQTAP